MSIISIEKLTRKILIVRKDEISVTFMDKRYKILLSPFA